MHIMYDVSTDVLPVGRCMGVWIYGVIAVTTAEYLDCRVMSTSMDYDSKTYLVEQKKYFNGKITSKI